MRLRAPIHLSDNSDEDDNSTLYRSSHSQPTHSPLLDTRSHSPPLPSFRPGQQLDEVDSPASTLSWTSPRSAPSLTSPHSLPHASPHTPLAGQSTVTSSDSELQRQLALDVAALRIERRQQRDTQAAAAAAARANNQQQQHHSRNSAGSGGEHNGAEKATLGDCFSDLRELSALAEQAEHWLSVMRAANTNANTTKVQSQQPSDVAIEDET